MHALNKPAGVVSTARDTHGRPTVVDLVALVAAALPGRPPRRRQHRPDPADQRRRAGQPAHPPALRGRQGLPRPRAAAAPSPARARRPCARACSSRTAAPRPRACAQVAPGRARDHHPRGPQAPGAAHVRGGRPPGGRAGARGVRPARSARAGARPQQARSRTPRWSACAARLRPKPPRTVRSELPDTIPRRAIAALAGRHHGRGERRRARSSTRREELVHRGHASATTSPPEHMVSCIFTCTDRPRTPSSPRSRRATSASSRVPLLCTQEIDVPGALPRVIRVLLHYYADAGPHAAARLPARGASRCARTSSASKAPSDAAIEFNRTHRGASRSTRPAPTYGYARATLRACSPRTRRRSRRTPAVLEAVRGAAARR